MSNSIRFEFYNNFDIWYDLYQENGGDPNYVINMMICVNKGVYEYGIGYGCVYGYGNGLRHEYGIGNKYRHGDGYEFIYGNKYKYGSRNGYEYMNGLLYTKGNGTF